MSSVCQMANGRWIWTHSVQVSYVPQAIFHSARSYYKKAFRLTFKICHCELRKSDTKYVINVENLSHILCLLMKDT